MAQKAGQKDRTFRFKSVMSVDGVDLVVVDLSFALILALTLSCDHLPLLSEILSIQFSKHPLESVHLIFVWLDLQTGKWPF